MLRELPFEILLPVLDICRLERSTRFLCHIILQNCAQQLRQFESPLLLRIFTSSVFIRIEHVIHHDVSKDIRLVEVVLTPDRTRVWLGVTKNYSIWPKTNQTRWDSKFRNKPCPPLRPRDFPTDTTLLRTFLPSILCRARFGELFIYAGIAEALWNAVRIFGNCDFPRISVRICDSINCFCRYPLTHSGLKRTPVEEAYENSLLNQALCRLSESELFFDSIQKCHITSSICRHLFRPDTSGRVSLSTTTIYLDDALIFQLAPVTNLEVVTKISENGKVKNCDRNFAGSNALLRRIEDSVV